jgi:hypothetical protein
LFFILNNAKKLKKFSYLILKDSIKKDKNKTILEDDAENILNESSLRGNDIENMIKRRITQSSKFQKRLSCTANDTRKNKKSSKTFLSGEYVRESYDEGDLFVNDSKIDIGGDIETRDKEPIFEKKDNLLGQEIEYNPPKMIQKQVDFIKVKESNVFNSADHDPKSRSNSKIFF